MRRQFQISPIPILVTHYSTLCGSRSSSRLRTTLGQLALPLAASGVAIVLRCNIPIVLAASLVTLTGIFSAFCFQLSVEVLIRAAAWAESKPEPGESTSSYAFLLEHLGANAMYAAMLSALVASTTLVAGVLDDGWPAYIFTSVTCGLALHLIMTMLLVLVRIFYLTRSRLNRARAGG